jgi:hypothetical protein
MDAPPASANPPKYDSSGRSGLRVGIGEPFVLELYRCSSAGRWSRSDHEVKRDGPHAHLRWLLSWSERVTALARSSGRRIPTVWD